MIFTKEALQQFKDLYAQEFSEALTEKEALFQAHALINLVQNTYKPLTKKEWKTYTKAIEIEE